MSLGNQFQGSTKTGGKSDRFAAFAHYFLAAIGFTIYADQVCPLLETLSPFLLFAPIALTYPLRVLLLVRLQKLPYERRIVQQFKLDIGLFISAGIGLVVTNLIAYDSLWHSNAKVLVGMAMLGLFVAVDLALTAERQLIQELVRKRYDLELGQHFVSFAQKFNMMAIAIIVSTALVLFLVVNKDLDWLLTEGIHKGADSARNSILLEVLVVMFVILAYSIRIILSYTKNLKIYLTHETQVLTAAAQGDLSVRVPIASQDEFGHMAQGTNAVIGHLQAYQQELLTTRDVSILALASLAETRDNETGAHILRTQRYVKVLAEHLSHHHDFVSELTSQTIELMYKSAPLHDVGKVGIPDSILLKPGKLTDAEFEVMKTHAQLGADALLVAEGQMGSNYFLCFAREIALTHHEKWDGSGYPRGLKGDEIPLSGRLMALADVYDALLSKRVYKPAFSHEKAKSIIIEGSGSHFDSRVVDAFIACEQVFIGIEQQFKDEEGAG
ncbi:MAG: HD domain-containing protein [Amphritea sp.]|nr:HD domain-containing protein [Amphritea sp.]MBQ0782774.1 HD domain-containing protein [Amphritea sp.]